MTNVCGLLNHLTGEKPRKIKRHANSISERPTHGTLGEQLRIS